MSPVNLMYWGIPGYAIFWGLLILAAILFLHRLYKLWRLINSGRKWEKTDLTAKKIFSTFFSVVLQWCQFKTVTRKDFSGILHVFIVFGFFIFIFYYTLYIVIGDGFGISIGIKNNLFFLYYAWTMDIAAVLVIIAALSSIFRRYILRPIRLKGEPNFETLVILITVLLHPTIHLLKTGSDIALGYFPAGLGVNLPIISLTLSRWFTNNDLMSSENTHIILFWVHWATILGVLVYIAYSKYLHIIVSPFNIVFHSSELRGSIKPIDFKTFESYGVAEIEEFSKNKLLECFACVSCGRCQENCPAYLTDKPLNPKQIVQKIKNNLVLMGSNRPEVLLSQRKSLNGDIVTEEELLACTTCGACVAICPVSNDQMGMILEFRRKLVDRGTFDNGHRRTLLRVVNDYNPFGTRWNRRAQNFDIEVAKTGEKYDYIFWLGCIASFDNRVKEVAQVLSNILNAAGLKHAILGSKERCCGDFARRLGDEGLYQSLAVKNIETLQELNFKYILTICPHCFNTFRNEYPQFNGDFKVVHHTQLISNLLKESRILLQDLSKAGSEKAIYHDPCYLGRFNRIYKEPRFILRKIFSELIEFPRKRSKSLCCGAGGGAVWKEEESGKKINVERMEEAMMKDPNIVVTACPFCFLMFQEAIQIKYPNKDVKLLDIAEVVEKYMQ